MLTDIQQIILEYCITTHHLQHAYPGQPDDEFDFAHLIIKQNETCEFKVVLGSIGAKEYAVLFHHNIAKLDPEDPKSIHSRSVLMQANSRILDYNDPSLFDIIDSYVKFAKQYPIISEYSNSLP